MRALHFVVNGKIRSVLISSLKPNVEYTVEIGEKTVQIQLDENSPKVEGVDWFFVQDGNGLILYDAKNGKKEVVPVSEVGYLMRALYRENLAMPITAYAWLEVVEPKGPPIKPVWLSGRRFPILMKIGGPSLVDENDVYLVVSANGRVVATDAICSPVLQELGLRYKAEGESGYLNPVYKAKRGERRYKVVCLTCLRDLGWAVIFRRVKWTHRGVEYDAEVFTPNGYLAYDIRYVEIPDHGKLDLEEWYEKAKEQCNRYMLTHGWIQLW